MDKEIYTEVFRHSEWCKNNEPNQLAHDYWDELDPRTRASDCFDVVFAKVDIFLANKWYFETVSPTAQYSPIPIRDMDLYIKFLEIIKKTQNGR